MGRVHPLAVLHLAPRTGAGRSDRKGRLAEFAGHGWNTDELDRPPGPAPIAAPSSTGRSSPPKHRRGLDLYRRLITLRAGEPDLA